MTTLCEYFESWRAGLVKGNKLERVEEALWLRF